jgi:hypothetical protein
MGILSKITKFRKNANFDYTPRYYDNKGEGSPYKFEQKFDQFRTTVGSQRGIKNKIGNAMSDIRRQGDENMRMRFFIILFILILGFLFFIDFDLSIFSPK